MITELGYISLLLALISATLLFSLPLLQAILPTQYFPAPTILIVLKTLSQTQCLALLFAFSALAYGFYSNDFSLLYVANHSNTLMPWYYKLSAVWGGHEGSLLLWSSILSVWIAMVAYKIGVLPINMQVAALSTLGAVQTCILLLVIFSSSPFVLNTALIIDGSELNPLLQDIGLIFHPPILYAGYVGMAVPFAFAIAALWVGRLDVFWVRWTRPWTLLAWSFLTLGIAMGSWWAYYELGWGGWWFWDPVENASLLPWVACTALLHAMAVTEKRGVFKAWTVLLAILAFALSLLGTFLVRSGVVTSVHAFANDPKRGLLILIMLSVLIGSALLLYMLRGWKLNSESRYQLKSKESLIAMNNIILSVAVVVILLGTLYPIFMDAFGFPQVSVGAPYYNTMLVPMTWLLLFLLGYAPLLRWKSHKQAIVGVSISVLFSALLLATITILLFNQKIEINSAYVTLVLVFWVLVFIFLDIKVKIKKGKSILSQLKRLGMQYWAMHLAHMGVLVTCLGISVNSTYSVEMDIAIKNQQTIVLKDINNGRNKQSFSVTLQTVKQVQKQNYTSTYAQLDFQLNSESFVTLTPEKRQYISQIQPMTEAKISANVWRDIYVALGEPLNADDVTQGWLVRIYYKPFVRWIWAGAMMMALAGFISMIDKKSTEKKG